MEEKHKDLKVTKQRELLSQILENLAKAHPDFYYLSTSDIAAALLDHVDTSAQVSLDQRALLKGLSHRDIQILLSLH